MIDKLVEFFPQSPSSRTVVVLEHNGDGAMSRVPDHETAFGHRGYPYNLLVTSIWADPTEADANISWTRQLWDAVRPSLADAVYVNYLGENIRERVRAAYDEEKFRRLSELKKKYDSANIFHLNPNIQPAK